MIPKGFLIVAYAGSANPCDCRVSQNGENRMTFETSLAAFRWRRR